jgi:hypothetical protein
MVRTSSSISRVLLCVFACGWGLSLGCGDDGASEPAMDAGGGGKPRTRHDASARDAGEEAEDAGDPLEEDSGEEPAEDAGGSAGNKSRVKGRVTYADGSAVGQVEVKIAGKTYKSDSRGVFSAEDLPAGEHEVSVEGEGVSRAQVKIEVSEDRVAQTELFVMPMAKAPVPDAASGGESGGATDNVKVKLSPGSLRVKKTGAAASGTAEARYAVSKESRDIKAAPGRLKGKRGEEDLELESFGIIDMRLFQGDEELELTQEAELELPLGPNAFSEGQIVDAWSFDADSGAWKAENKAVVDKSKGANGVAKIKATHFSWWSVAQPVEAPTCLSGRLLAADDQPLPYLWVQAVATSYWGASWAQTDADGRFCLSVKQGTSHTLSAFGVEASTYFEWQQSVSAGSGAAACGGTGTCTDLGDVAGESLFDECTGNVTNNQNHVYVISSTNTELDAALVAMLETSGHTVTMGVGYALFDGTIDLSPYDAVYLQANANWSGDMPVLGQRQLINWVNCGGGLVTVEWTTWKIALGDSAFQLIDAIFPAVHTSNYASPATETYTKVTDDPTLNAGLPDTFTFNTTNYGGTESYLNPRAGALIYYDSGMLDAGVIGWDYNLGRVLSFSTTVGTNEIADPNFSRLIGNAIDWVQRD